MDYWAEAMQDDVYTLASDGWQALQDGKPNADLIPRHLIVARYFKAEQAAMEKLQADADALTRRLEELDEEHSSEDSLLIDARTDKNKLTAKSVKDRLKTIKHVKDADDERRLLEQVLDLMEQEAAAGKEVKDAQRMLDAKIAAKYPKLSEAEIKALVVDDKWLARLAADVESELNRVSQARYLWERISRAMRNSEPANSI
jgi:type I restriction enzyme M protein